MVCTSWGYCVQASRRQEWFTLALVPLVPEFEISGSGFRWNAMKYRYLGKTGLPVSRVCLGTLTFGSEKFGCDEAESARMVRTFYDQGGNFFDTADAYHQGASETMLGQAIQQLPRNDLVIATKCFFPMGTQPTAKGLSRKHIMEACESSLMRLKTDYIDLYQIHGPDPFADYEDSCRALDDLVRQGKVRYIGCSNLYAWQVMKMNAACDRLNLNRLACGQYLYNLVVRDIEREIIPACMNEGMGVICWSPLASGVLTGKFTRSKVPDPGPAISFRVEVEFERFWNERTFDIMEKVQVIADQSQVSPAQMAMGWILKKQGITSVIFGAKNLEQLDQNMAAGSWEMPDDMETELDKIASFDEGYPSFWVNRWKNEFFSVNERHDEFESDPNS